MNISLDVAALAGTLVWALVILFVLVRYPKALVSIGEGLGKVALGLASRVQKLEFAGLSIELAAAKRFTPEWAPAHSEMDVRRSAAAFRLSDSLGQTFREALMSEGTADYAEVNLGAGHEWLTSRLFIISIVLARAKGLDCFVFLETAGVRRQFVGWARPDRVRWALAREYPWFETAYAAAYQAVMQRPGQASQVVSSSGRLGLPDRNDEITPNIDLIQEFLTQIQVNARPPSPDGEAWIEVDASTQTYEHTEWLSADGLESLLGSDLISDQVREADLRSLTPAGVLSLARMPGAFVAMTSEGRRFESMLVRARLLEQALTPTAQA